MALIRLDGPKATALLAVGSGARLIYLGPRLGDDVALAGADFATHPGRRESQADEDPGLTLLPQAGGAFMGEPAVDVGAPSRFRVANVESGGDALCITYRDEQIECELRQHMRMLPSGLLSSRAELINRGPAPRQLGWLTALSLQLPDWARVATEVNGGWGAEFQLSEAVLPTGKLEKINRTGRSGFGGAHYRIVGQAGVSETQGRVLAVHLAWSGNCRSLIETLPSGERQLQIGEWLASHEITIPPGRTYRSPEALLVVSDDGWNCVRHAFHEEFRVRRVEAGIGRGERKVHFNSWEAAYFDIDEARLCALARDASAVGAERFVLDDGWFSGRRDDRSSLGDWTVDPTRFPNGLAPLIDEVARLGMDFGLWIEPEMVSPQSELARAHPDWCLHAGRAERPTQRHQLVLDLTRSEVRNYLFEAIDRLLRENAIAYLKWDHNRDLFPAMSHGRPAGHWQTLAYYDLLDRIRRAHPEVEIESCASGGARVDFALAGRAARFWTSDNTDPVERLRIQRAMSMFYPLEVIGSHVGAAPNPTTGRSTAMLFRARAAIFGHFGVEADPGRLDDEERSILRAHAELYKQHRRLLLRGRLSYGDCSDPDVSIAIVSSADGSEALALVTRTTHSRTAVGPPVRFPGLREEGRYRVRLLEPWPARSAERFEDEEFWRAEPVLDGATLGQVGVQLHLVRPDTAWLIHLQAERGSRG